MTGFFNVAPSPDPRLDGAWLMIGHLVLPAAVGLVVGLLLPKVVRVIVALAAVALVFLALPTLFGNESARRTALPDAESSGMVTQAAEQTWDFGIDVAQRSPPTAAGVMIGVALQMLRKRSGAPA